jgi:hypothetical protein
MSRSVQKALSVKVITFNVETLILAPPSTSFCRNTVGSHMDCAADSLPQKFLATRLVSLCVAASATTAPTQNSPD